MKMNVEFNEDLNNDTSQAFLKLAHKVEEGLLPPLKKASPAVTAINVYSFKPGSVLAEYRIIMDSHATGDVSKLQFAIGDIISRSPLTGLGVNRAYVPQITGTCCLFLILFR